MPLRVELHSNIIMQRSIHIHAREIFHFLILLRCASDFTVELYEPGGGGGSTPI